MDQIGAPSTADEAVLDVPDLLRAYPRRADRAKGVEVCAALIEFARENGLVLSGHLLGSAEHRVVRSSDLTDLGRLTFSDLMYDWLTYTDDESGTVDRAKNVAMLGSYFRRIVAAL